ncbi:MAG TPA: hypothetical protein VGF30_00020 [Bacteroidia bacterium]
MKKFLKKILFFAAPLVVPFVICFFYFGMNSKRKIDNYKFPVTVNKLVIGDSHTRLAINDSLLPNTVNMSQNSEGMIYTYYKLKAFIKANPQIDTVFFGVGYHSFAGYYDDHILLPDISSRYFFVLPLKDQLHLFKNTKSPGLLVLKSMLLGLNNAISSGTKLSFVGAYENYTTKAAISDSSIAQRIQSAYYNKKERSGFSQSNTQYYQEIVKLCKEHNIHVYVINAPTHSKYAKQVPGEFRNKYYTTINNSGVELIEFSGLQLEDKDFLPDGDHVTKNGAAQASNYLREQLSKSKNAIK